MRLSICAYVFFFTFLTPLWSQNSWICGNSISNYNYTPLKSLNCMKSSATYNNFYKHKEFYIPRDGSNEDFIKNNSC